MSQDTVKGLSSTDVQHQAACLQDLRDLLEDELRGVLEEELSGREADLMEGLATCASSLTTEVLRGTIGRSLCLYAQRLKGFPAVWRVVLEHVTPTTPFQRLRAHVRLVRVFLDAGADVQEGQTQRIMNALIHVLESTRRVELLPEITPALSALALRTPADFSKFFQDTVDLILGWAVDAALPDEHRTVIIAAFSSFRGQWRAEEHRSFAGTLQRKLLDDLQRATAGLPPQSGEEGSSLYTLLHCFRSVSSAMGNLGEVYPSIVPVLLQCFRFCFQRLSTQPGQAVRDLRVAIGLHLMCVEVAGASIDLKALRRVLQDKAFRLLCISLDASLRNLVLQTYLVVLRNCGHEATQMALETLVDRGRCSGLTKWLPQGPEQLAETSVEAGEGVGLSEEELQALTSRERDLVAAVSLAVAGHSPHGLPLLRQVIRQLPERQRGVLLPSIWDAASVLSSQSRGGGSGPNQEPPWKLDDLESELASALRSRRDAAGLLRAVVRANRAFWTCLSPGAQGRLLPLIWQAQDLAIETAPQPVDVVLALCPGRCRAGAQATALYLHSIQPYVADLLGCTEGPIVARCAEARARLLALSSRVSGSRAVAYQSFELPTSGTSSSSQPRRSPASMAALVAPQLRSLLAVAAPLEAPAFVSFLSSLRSSDGDLDLPALFMASAPALEELPRACRPHWIVLQAASFFVNHRLKSPFGSASSSLQFLETMLVDASMRVGQSVQDFLTAALERMARGGAEAPDRGLWSCGYKPLVSAQVVHVLEQLILLAQEPVHIHMQPRGQLHSKSTCQFFDANRRVCGDWFQRMRGVLRQTLARYGSHPAHYMVSVARLADVLRQLVPATANSPLSLIVLVGRSQRGGDGAAPKTPRGQRSHGGAAAALPTAPCLKGEEPAAPAPPAADGSPGGGRRPGEASPDVAAGGAAAASADKSLTRMLDGLEQNLAPLLSGALALRNVGLTRGICALHSHGALTLTSAAATCPCQSAFLAFAEQKYEEATVLFSQIAAGGASGEVWVREALGSRPMQALVARTWLESAMQAVDCEGVDRWLEAYEGSSRVSNAMRAFAKSYASLLRKDFPSCDRAIRETVESTGGDWMQAEGSERSASHMHENVCRLSRWSDLGSVFMVEASMAVSGTPSADLERASRALSDARSCLQADIAARSYVEPCLLLHGADAYEPNAAALEVIADVETLLLSKQQQGKDSGEGSSLCTGGGILKLHAAAIFGFPVLTAEAERLRLVKHCLRTQNVKLASSILSEVKEPAEEDVSHHTLQITLHRSLLLEGQQRPVEAFQVIHQRVLRALDLVTAAAAASSTPAVNDSVQAASEKWLSGRLLSVTALDRHMGSAEHVEGFAMLLARYAKLLGDHGSLLSTQLAKRDGSVGGSPLAQMLEGLQGRTSRTLATLAPGLAGHGPFRPEMLQRWQDILHGPGNAARSELLCPLVAPGAATGSDVNSQVDPHFLGWFALQGCLLCPSSAKLWSRYGDWLFAHRTTVDMVHLGQAVSSTLDQRTGAGGSRSVPPEELRALCRCAREALRRWTHASDQARQQDGGLRSGAERPSAEWLLAKTKIGSCSLWQGLGSKEQQQRLVAVLGELCSWISDWQDMVSTECIRAYMHNLQLEDAAATHPRMQRTLLRLLRILAQQSESRVWAASAQELLLGSEMPVVSARLWEPLLPQLLAYMEHPAGHVSAAATELFASVARAEPRLAIFPALAADAPEGVVEPEAAELKAVMAETPAPGRRALKVIRGLHPEMLQSSEIFARALNVMATPVDEVCTRLLQYAETFLVEKSGVEAADGIVLVLARFSCLLEALDKASGESRCTAAEPRAFRGEQADGERVDEGVEQLRLMGVQPCLDAPYARRFLASFLPALRRMIFLHRPCILAPLTDAGTAELLNSLLSHLRLLLRTCAHFSRASAVPLQELAPALVEMFREGGASSRQPVVLPVSTSFSGSQLLHIRQVSQKVHILSTKTKPKKLEFEAADGTSHVFLLKGRDDLRLDGRIMQLLQAINSIIAEDQSPLLAVTRGPPAPAGPALNLRCRDYDVVPIAPRAGLIRWVSAVPLFLIHKQRRHFLQLERSGGEQKHLQESSTDLWHKRIQQHLKSLDVDQFRTPRRHWPVEALLKTFKEMEAESSPDIISRELLLSALHPAQHFNRCMAFTSSIALSSVLGHLIGLGDRHLDNLLLDLSTGEVVHVDYSICFDRGRRLRVPERVPFRLTRCMVTALGPAGVGGLFLQTAEVGLGLLREWRELVLSLAEPCFLLAPPNDWVYPVSSPFKATQAAGGMVRRLCRSLIEALGEGGAVFADAAQAAGQIVRLVEQCDVVLDAQSRHTGLKVHMSKEVKHLIDKSKNLEETKLLQQQLQEIREEQSAVLDTVDFQMSQLQSHATGPLATALDRQRRVAMLLLDPDSPALEQDSQEPFVQTCRKLLAMEAQPKGVATTPLRAAVAATLEPLAHFRTALAPLLLPPPHQRKDLLPSSRRELVLWSLLAHSPDKVRLDQLCACGLVGVDAAWRHHSRWARPESGGGGDASAEEACATLGASVEKTIKAGQPAVEALQQLVPRWGLEAVGGQAKQLLRAEVEISEMLERLEAWTAPEGAVGAARSSELLGTHADAKEAIQEDAQKMLRPGLAGFGGRTTGLQRRKLSALLLSCLREAAEIFEASKGLCGRRVSEFSLSAYVSQAMDSSYPSLSQTPEKQAASQLLGLPLHGQFTVLCERVLQLVQVLIQANLIDFRHNVTLLAHHWQEVGAALVGVEAAAVAASAAKVHLVDLVGQLTRSPDEEVVEDVEEQAAAMEEEPSAPTSVEAASSGAATEWPSLSMSTKSTQAVKKGKGKKGGAKSELSEGDMHCSTEKLCQELHHMQNRLRGALHPATLAGGGAAYSPPEHQTAARYLGLPKVQDFRTWVSSLLHLRQLGEALCSDVARVREMPPSSAREEAVKKLQDAVADLRLRCEEVMAQVDELLKPQDRAHATPLLSAARQLATEVHEAAYLQEQVSLNVRSTPVKRLGWNQNSDDSLRDGFYTQGVLPEHFAEIVRSQFVPDIDQPFLGEEAQHAGSEPPGSRPRRVPGQALLVDLMFARAQVELLLSALLRPDAPILISSGVELARFTTHALFPCFSQVVSYLFTFLLEQLHSLQDLSATIIPETSLTGIVGALSALGIDLASSQDVAQLCSRQAHAAMLLRLQRVLEATGESARATVSQARSQLQILQWCHLGSCLAFEAASRSQSEPARTAELNDLLQLRSLGTLEAAPGVTCLAVVSEGPQRPVKALSALVQASTVLRRLLEEPAAGEATELLGEANDLLLFISDIIRLFTGGLGQPGEDAVCAFSQSWARASGTLQMLQEGRAKEAELLAKLQELQFAHSSPHGRDDHLMGMGSEAALAQTLQDISIEGERLEEMREKAKAELEQFMAKYRSLVGNVLALSQPSLEGTGTHALWVQACTVVSPLQHFRKVIVSTKDLKESSRSNQNAPSALREIRVLPESLGSLRRLCELWLNPQSGLRTTAAHTVITRSGHEIPPPPTGAPPPPPLPPKELDDGDPVTTEAGSSRTSEEDSSQNEYANAAEEGEGSQAAARTAATEEEHLAQDREEVEEQPAEPAAGRSESPGDVTESPDEEDGSEEEGSSGKGDSEPAWKTQAVYAVRSISRKIPKARARLDLHAEGLIAAATNPEQLAQMYEGWTAWI